MKPHSLAAADPSQLDELLEEYKSEMILSPIVLTRLQEQFVSEMVAGLHQPGGSSLLMLPSYVTRLPDGTEHGAAYALDLGGTNFRVVYVHLSQKEGRVESKHVSEVPIPKEVYEGHGEHLFDFMANALITFMEDLAKSQEPQDSTPPPVGFCFSFPTEQKALNHGKLMVWTKGFSCEGVVGEDVVAMLSAALARRDSRCNVAALLNDTVGVLAASRYLDSNTEVGMIIGTGTNACYVERVGAIPKWQSDGIDPDTKTVVNIEWGNFQSKLLPRTQADRDLDALSTHPGEYLFEKLVSGMYLGEVARLILLRLATDGQLFGEEVPERLQIKDSFSTATLAAIHEDSSADLAVTRQKLAAALKLDPDSLEQSVLWTVGQVCDMVALRSVLMVAVALLAILRKTGWWEHPRRVVVAVDGGVYAKWARYRTLLVDCFSQLLGDRAADLAPLVEIRGCHDGSALGAAVLAAAAAGRNSSTASLSSKAPVPVVAAAAEPGSRCTCS